MSSFKFGTFFTLFWRNFENTIPSKIDFKRLTTLKKTRFVSYLVTLGHVLFNGINDLFILLMNLSRIMLIHSDHTGIGIVIQKLVVNPISAIFSHALVTNALSWVRINRLFIRIRGFTWRRDQKYVSMPP